MSDSEWLNLNEAAEYMGRIAPSTLRALANGHKVSSSRVGRQLVFRIEWLDEYLELQKSPRRENPFGLTDQALINVRDARPTRTKKAS